VIQKGFAVLRNRNYVLRFRFRQVSVPIPAPYLDHKKQFSKNKLFVKNLAYLMLIEAALLPKNLSSRLFFFFCDSISLPALADGQWGDEMSTAPVLNITIH
jgi:hypothetical protein